MNKCQVDQIWPLFGSQAAFCRLLGLDPSSTVTVWRNQRDGMVPRKHWQSIRCEAFRLGVDEMLPDWIRE